MESSLLLVIVEDPDVVRVPKTPRLPIGASARLILVKPRATLHRRDAVASATHRTAEAKQSSLLHGQWLRELELEQGARRNNHGTPF